MVKTFCDKCAKPMKTSDGPRVRRQLGRFTVEIIHGVDKIWNGGHLCHRCVVEIVNEGKRMPE